MESLSVNFHLLPVKASYFCILGAVASLLPFLTVYMRQAGLSTLECAVVYGTMPFIGAFIRPLFGAVADAWKKHKAILAVCCVMTGVFHGLLLAVPHHKYSAYSQHYPEAASSDMWMDLTCDTDGSSVLLCPKDILLERGCTEGAFNRTQWDNYQPSTTMHDCSLRCFFEESATETATLCLHRENTTVCPLYKDDRNKINSLPTITKLDDHLHRFHHIYKKFHLPVATFEVELEYLQPYIHGMHNEPNDYCYRYALNRIEYNGTYFDGTHTGITCDVRSELKCFLDCDVLPDLTHYGFDCPDKYISEPHGAHAHFGRIFWMFFLIFLVAQIWFAPLVGLNDGIVYDHLGEERHRWGQQRLWGTVGFVVFAFISGLAMDVFSHSLTGAGVKNYTPAFVLYIVNMLIAAIIVMLYKISPEVRASQICKRGSEILLIPEVMALLVVVFVFGMYTGAIETFLFMHLQDLGAPQYLLGLCMVMNCLPEILILMFAGYILQKLGYINALYLVFVAYFVRMLSYSFIGNAYLVLIVEPLHSVTFGLMWAAASGYASQATPTGMHGTVQGLISGLHFGIGKGVGALVGGWVASWSEIHLMFRYFAVSSLLVLVLYFAFNVLRHRCQGRDRRMRIPSHDDKTDQNGHQQSRSRDQQPEMEGARLSTLLDDLSVGFDKDKQALVFKDDPDV